MPPSSTIPASRLESLSKGFVSWPRTCMAESNIQYCVARRILGCWNNCFYKNSVSATTADSRCVQGFIRSARQKFQSGPPFESLKVIEC